ncbi:MAG: LamG domain-containing protein, partial [Pirellulales bacterium]
MSVAALLSFAAPAFAIVVFSYAASTGQFPTEQGWLAHEIDTTGPLTDPSPGGTVSGTTAINANAAIEMIGGMIVLHLRDTLTDSSADLPEFYFPWTTGQQLTLINNGLKFTMVVQGLTNASANGNMRFGFNGTEFEIQNTNIGPDRTVEVVNFGGGLFPIDGNFHTLVVTGQKNGANFDFSYTVDDGASTPLNIVANPAPATFESTVYFGALSSGGRNTDILVKSVVMETLADVLSQVAVIERTNNSPYGSLTFTNNSGPITVVGYSVLSNGGALHPGQWTSIANNYDLGGDQIVDDNDEWLELTDSASRTDLGEFEPDGDGAVIGTGQSISLGNVWIQNPTEDVTMELLLIDGSILPVPVQFAGNGGNPFNFGDLGFDGSFDVDDFHNKFVPGFAADTSALSQAEKYQAGDFNRDGLVDEFDFLIYNAAYLAATPGAASLSFSNVPEPAAVALLAAGVFAGALYRRRSRGLPSAGFAIVLLIAGAMGALPARTQAADPVAYWTFNEPGGATALNDAIGGNHSTSVGTAASGAVGQIGSAWSFDGSDNAIAIDAGTGDLTELGFNYSFSAWVKSTDNLGVILAISDNTEGSEEVALRVSDNGDPDGRAGLLGRPNIDGPGNEALSTAFINDDKWHHVTFTSNSTGWNIYVDGVLENSGTSPTSPSAIGANSVRIGVNEDSGGLQWGLLGTLDDISVWDGPLTDAEVANLYVKGLFGRGAIEEFTDALSLEVSSTGSGAVTFKNTGGTPFEIDLYRIVSPDSSLQASGWNSLDNQDFDSSAWTELANDDGKISEGAFGDSTVLAGGFSRTLGNLYNTSLDAQDLVLEYHLVGTPAALL